MRLFRQLTPRVKLVRHYASFPEIKPCLEYTSITHPDTPAPQATLDLIRSHSQYQLNTYIRPPILFTRGSKCNLYDSVSREYLDFSAGIAVTALGHSDPGVTAVIVDQASKLSHLSNVYWNEWAGALAKSIVDLTTLHGGLGLKSIETTSSTNQDAEPKVGAQVFFSNTGTEANEGALKFARKYGKQIGGETKTGIVCFSNAFHGRTMGAISCTPNPKYQKPFEPLIPGVRVGEYNDMDEERMKVLIDDSVCGVIVEPIQGEGGVGTGKVEWLEMLGKRCRQVGAVLIYDEIQCGLFRTGEMWAHSSYPEDAQPDIITMAKPLANGFPIGAILVRSNIAESITTGSHGTTFGGQPLATRIGHYVLSRLSDPSFITSINTTAQHLDDHLSRLPRLFPHLVSEIRGRGLIRGIAFKDEKMPGEVVRMARERGVLFLTAGKDTVRLVPALIVSEEECDRAIGVLESCLALLSEKQ
ncbi:acetylornithine aminotransferase [Tremella mesenterica]|uniref:acetylornithine transaminase n=1 Tax=Tremella mesenterica TaxID=5217 RepID=A0A4Q1BRM3_TREME|nr:acetylornithine aminotransferase [Tremella mesenterica]